MPWPSHPPQCGWLAERQGSRPQFTVHGVRAPSYPWRYGISLDQEEDWSPWNYSFSFWKKTKQTRPPRSGDFSGSHWTWYDSYYLWRNSKKICWRTSWGCRASVLCLQWDRDFCLSKCVPICWRTWRGRGSCAVSPVEQRSVSPNVCPLCPCLTDGSDAWIHSHKCSLLSKCYLNIIIHDVNDFQAPVGPYPFSLL